MHIVLRSSLAKGEWSMKRRKNEKLIESYIGKFAHKYGVRVHSSANVGNHLHLHIQLANRHAYRPFIRALTGAIAMAITGFSRWKKAPKGFQFWDYRPYSRVVFGWRGFTTLRSYVEQNQREGLGYPEDIADNLKQEFTWVDYAAEGIDLDTA